jgi:hypothetical protein
MMLSMQLVLPTERLDAIVINLLQPQLSHGPGGTSVSLVPIGKLKLPLPTRGSRLILTIFTKKEHPQLKLTALVIVQFLANTSCRTG